MQRLRGLTLLRCRSIGNAGNVPNRSNAGVRPEFATTLLRVVALENCEIEPHFALFSFVHR
jgi:hypothetical protein